VTAGSLLGGTTTSSLGALPFGLAESALTTRRFAAAGRPFRLAALPL
jgi:hypothetical protein